MSQTMALKSSLKLTSQLSTTVVELRDLKARLTGAESTVVTLQTVNEGNTKFIDLHYALSIIGLESLLFIFLQVLHPNWASQWLSSGIWRARWGAEEECR